MKSVLSRRQLKLLLQCVKRFEYLLTDMKYIYIKPTYMHMMITYKSML